MPRVKIKIPPCPVCNCTAVMDKSMNSDSFRFRCPNAHIATEFSYREYEAKSKWKRIVKRKLEEMRSAHGIIG